MASKTDVGSWMLINLAAGESVIVSEDALCAKIGTEFFIDEKEESAALSAKERKRANKAAGQVKELSTRL
jgi:hypothetical protein